MELEQALPLLKRSECISRISWPHGEFVYLVPGHRFVVDRVPLSDIYPKGAELTYHSHIDKRMADGTHMPWTPTNDDILATDYVTTHWQR